MKHTSLLFFLFIFFSSLAHSQPIHEYMDLQTHPMMHMQYGFFGEGMLYFSEGNDPELTYKHQFTNVNYANYLVNNKGSRIICTGVVLSETRSSKKKSRKKAMAQINFINDFVELNSDQFALAKSPQEVRDLVHNTDKTIIIHSIEGAKKLVNSQEDANFWAGEGVAFMTLIHLMDDELGGAATRPEFVTKMINMKGQFKKGFAPKKHRGLTEKGKQAISWLANAGIMTDLTHMSDDSREDALNYMEEKGIPPLVTHDVYKPIQNQPRGIMPEDIFRIYKQNGFTSLPISGFSTSPHKPWPEIAAQLDTMKNHCQGSIDSYQFTYNTVKKQIEDHVHTITGDPNLTFSGLTEEEKTRFAIGFQSDFNGWLNHSRPKYGEEGCFDLDPSVEYERIEIEGMPHPGLLESQWRYLEKQGVDLAPIKRASERFLQLWEGFLERKGTY